MSILNQVVTTLKNTAKPVTEVQFPAITICGSGSHMSHVEKKIKENFLAWRLEEKRKGEATEEDFEDYMFSTFQIKSDENETDPANILDILNTMVSPNVDASVAANGLRENAIACEEEQGTSTVRKKRDDDCEYSCANADFNLHGLKCYKWFNTELNYSDAMSACEDRGATLVTIANAEEDSFTNSNKNRWIGLNDLELEGDLVWTDSSVLSFTNWAEGQPRNNEENDCVSKARKRDSGLWAVTPCEMDDGLMFICSMAATSACSSTMATTPGSPAGKRT